MASAAALGSGGLDNLPTESTHTRDLPDQLLSTKLMNPDSRRKRARSGRWFANLNRFRSKSTSTARYEYQPGHVSLTYDETLLKRYRPRLEVSHLDVQPDYLYGWIATSSERNTDMACYWAWYTAGQTGLTDRDTHVPDREPVYVEFSPSSGEVLRVLYDEIHYTVGSTSTPPIHDVTHPKLHVINPWHNYELLNDGDGRDIDLNNMHDAYEGWLANGWNVHRPSVVDPWIVSSRGDWWPDDLRNSAGLDRLAVDIAQLYDRLGIDRAPNPLRRT